MVILLLKISKASRAFVITQNAFPAFALEKHNNIYSLMNDKFGVKFIPDFSKDQTQEEFDELIANLAQLKPLSKGKKKKKKKSKKKLKIVKGVLVEENGEEKPELTREEGLIKHQHPLVFADYLLSENNKTDVSALSDEDYPWYSPWHILAVVEPKLAKLRKEG